MEPSLEVGQKSRPQTVPQMNDKTNRTFSWFWLSQQSGKLASQSDCR